MEPAEVEFKIYKVKAKTAIGLDLVCRNTFRRNWVYVILDKLFLVANNLFPQYFQINGTALFPKSGTNLKDSKNWRPVSSILSKIFSSIINTRFRSHIKLSERQNGFINENGCQINISILNAALKYMTVIQLDISKAIWLLRDSSLKGYPRTLLNTSKSCIVTCPRASKLAMTLWI